MNRAAAVLLALSAPMAVVPAHAGSLPRLQPVVPQPITNAEMEANDLCGVGCSFLPGKIERGLIALADDMRGVVKLGGHLVRLRPDARSPEMPYAARSRYVGNEYVLSFAKTARRPTSVGEESEDWPATMTLKDRYGRTVFFLRGTLNCGA